MLQHIQAMESHIQTQGNKSIDQAYRLHFVPFQLLQPSSDDLLSMQQLIEANATKIQHLSIARRVIRQLLSQYIQEAAPPRQLCPKDEYLLYLSQKKALYLQYYFIFEPGTSPSNDNLWVFDSRNLLGMFKRIKQMLEAFTPLVKRKHGIQNTSIKIQGFAFLEEIEGLLCELKHAAFPFKLYQQNQHIFTAQPQIVARFDMFLQEEKTIQAQFAINRQSFIIHSIIELGYQIEARNKWLQQQQTLRAKKNATWQEAMHQISEEKILNHHKADLLYYQTLSHYHAYISKGMKPCLDQVRNFLANEPLAKLKEQQLQELIAERILKSRCCKQLYRIQKYILKAVIAVSEVGNKTEQEIQESLITFGKILQRWYLLQKYNPNTVLLENIAATWRLRHSIRKDSLQGNGKQIRSILRLYVHILTSDLMDCHQEAINKMIAYDQELTYQLLTSPSVMKALLAQEHKIKALILQFSPLLKMWLTLSKIGSRKDQIRFMSELFQSLDQMGRLDRKEKATAHSKVKLKKVTSDIETLFQFQFEHESFVLIRPYLLEFKHILLLLQALKHDIHRQNINRSENDWFKALWNVAGYFSQERPYCVFYELKSQILLFIVLFKLGYHSPVCQRQSKTISLRNHILNLYSKIYQNNQGSNILLSRISLDLSKRKSSNQQYYIFDPEKLDHGQAFNITQSVILQSEDPQEQSVVQLGASEELIANLKRFIKTMSTNLSENEDSCKVYLLNLMNLLESELFMQERHRSTEREGILRNHYIEHLKANIASPKDQQKNLQSLLAMEGHFYSQNYDVAWKMLRQQLHNNPTFTPFLQEVLKFSTSSQLLRLVRVHTVFSKMNHLFLAKEDSSKDMEELCSAVNGSTDFPVGLQALRSVYQLCCQQRRVQQLQQFFRRATAANQQEGKDYAQFDTCLTKLRIQTFKEQSKNKQLIKIKIPIEYSEYFPKIRETIQKYYLFNNPGLSRVREVKEIQGTLCILIESNPFFILSPPPPHQSVIRCAVNDFMENNTEKLVRNFASSLIQANHLFQVGNHSQRIELTQIKIDDKQYCFNINPFFMFIQAIFQNFEDLQDQTNATRVSVLNRIWLAKILQITIETMRDRCSLHFLSNYDSLIEKLRNFSHTIYSYSSLLELPLFMTLHEKEMFVVYFYNKMSEMSDQFFIQERKLKKENRQEELLRLRANSMRNPVFRNHRYNFSLNGVVQRRMIELRVCETSSQEKLDWLTNHQGLKISYEIPRNEKKEVKEYVYSLNFMMKCLRGAIAHKMQNSYDFIQSFNNEYPQLIDFLHAHKHLLGMNYSEVLKRKEAWLSAYFSPDPQEVVRNLKSFIDKQINQGYRSLFTYS